MGIKYFGNCNQLAFQFESGTYALASGTRQWIGLVQGHEPADTLDIIPIRYQGNFTRNVTLYADGKEEYGGTFTYYPQDWKFLAFALGSAQVLTGSVLIRESDCDDANYAVANQTLSSFTLEDAKKTASTGSNFIRTYKGCMIDSFKMTMSEGEIASCEVGYKAQNCVYSSGTVTTVTARTTKPYMWSDMNVQLPSGTKLTNCVTYDFTVNNNLESRFPLNGSRTIESVIPLNRDYEVAATFLMDSDNASALYNTYYLGGASFNSMIEVKATAGSAYIIMSGCRITDMTIPSPVEGLTEQTCTIMPANVYVNVYDAIGSYNAW
jgi:hypothetical protein